MLADAIAETPELKQKVPTMTILIVLVTLAIGYMIGTAQTTLSMQDKYFESKVEDIYKYIDKQHSFAIDEVGGVRSDMDKEDRHLRNAIDLINEQHGTPTEKD